MPRQLDDTLDDEQQTFSRQLSGMLDALGFPPAFRARSRTWHPPTDVYEAKEAVIVKIEIAGMDPDAFEISFADRVLTVQGVRRDNEDKVSYHCLEIPYGEFQTRVFIPGSYLQDEIQAHYENGYLYVTLPKSREHRVPIRKIVVD